MDSGDTAWLLMSTALVMIMLPGLALFYGGLVRRKNVLSTIMHSFFGLAIVRVVWVIVGFTLAFGPDVNGWGLIGGLDFAFFNGVGLEPSATYAVTVPFVLFAGFLIYLGATKPLGAAGRIAPWALLALFIALYAFDKLEPKVAADTLKGAAPIALAAYLVITVLGFLLDRTRAPKSALQVGA